MTDFIFGPTLHHGLKYCELNDLNPQEFTFLDLNNPWYILEKRLEGLEDGSHVRVLDNDYMHNPVLFQNVMSYLEEHDSMIKMEIVEGVYFN